MLDDEILAVNGESVAGASAAQELLVSAVRAKQEVNLTLKRQPSSKVNVTPPQSDIVAEPQTDIVANLLSAIIAKDAAAGGLMEVSLPASRKPLGIQFAAEDDTTAPRIHAFAKNARASGKPAQHSCPFRELKVRVIWMVARLLEPHRERLTYCRFSHAGRRDHGCERRVG